MRLLLCLLLLFWAAPAYPATDPVQVVRDARQVLNEMLAVQDGCAPAVLIGQAEAVAIFPAVVKAGLIVGGRYGQGVLLLHDQGPEWKDPLLLELVGGSLGAQAGAASVDLILVFGSGDLVTRMLNGKIALNADVGMTAGPLGDNFRQLDAEALRDRIFVYTRTKGVFAGVSIEGASLSVDQQSNSAYYGVDGISSGKILAGDLAERPLAGQRLQKELSDYLKRNLGCPIPQVRSNEP